MRPRDPRHHDPQTLISSIYGLFSTADESLCPEWERDLDTLTLRFYHDPRCEEEGVTQRRFTISPSGERVARLHREGLTLRSRTLDAELRAGGEVEITGVAWSPDEGRIAATARLRGRDRPAAATLRAWDLTDLDPSTDEPPLLPLPDLTLGPLSPPPLAFSSTSDALWTATQGALARTTLSARATPPQLTPLPPHLTPLWLTPAPAPRSGSEQLTSPTSRERLALIGRAEGALRLWVMDLSERGAVTRADEHTAAERCAWLGRDELISVIPGEAGALTLTLSDLSDLSDRSAPHRLSRESGHTPLAHLPAGRVSGITACPQRRWIAVAVNRAGEAREGLLLAYQLTGETGERATATLIGRTPLREPINDLTLGAAPYSAVAALKDGPALFWLP